MKIKIENIFETPRIFGHLKYQHIINSALKKEIIKESDLITLAIQNHCIFSSRRLGNNIITRIDNLQKKLDRFSPDFSNISRKIQNHLARMYNINNFNDIGLATIKIEDHKILLQFYIDRKRGWQDLEVQF